jgi:hypothetical protein
MIRFGIVVLLAAGFAFPAGAARNVALASESAVAAADSEFVNSTCYGCPRNFQRY